MPEKAKSHTNPDFVKWRTFPDSYDAEEELLKLEGWLCLIWDGIDPIEYLWELEHESEYNE